MKAIFPWMLVALALAVPPASAAVSGKRANAPVVLPPLPSQRSSDPFASVFIVSSEDTYRGSVQAFAQGANIERDALGRFLVMSEVREHRLSDVSQAVHDGEGRCGGYFAFATRADALAFLRDDQSLLALKKLPAAPYRINNGGTVLTWLPQVQEANIRGTIFQLSTGFQNRYFASNSGRDAATWIRDTWLAFGQGRSDVTAELLAGCLNCSIQPSVILTVLGTDRSNEIVVLGAHLDSISNRGTGDSMIAPGADDDASGIATLTEVIRIALASGWRPSRTVKFMGYAAEEVGLRGSRSIAQDFQAQGRNVVAVLQLDMTNYRTVGAPDMRLITDYSNAALSTHMVGIFDAYLAPLGYTRGTYTCGYACSDHASWTSAGYPAAMMFEPGDGVGDFPFIHTVNDTLARMGDRADGSVAFGKLGLAFLGELAKNAPVAGNVSPVANFSAKAKGYDVSFSDLSTDADGSIATRRWDFGDGSSSIDAQPAKTYPASARYRVTLTVTDTAGASSSRTIVLALPSGLGVETPVKRRNPAGQ